MKRLLLVLFFCVPAAILGAQADDSVTVLVTELSRNLDIVWVLVSAVLVFFMQAGFMALESGMSRAKNSINVAIKNLADFVVGTALYWFVGFGIMFGTSFFGLFGTNHFMVSLRNDPWIISFFVFQVVFAGTASTIDSGALAERTKFSSYVLISGITSLFIYPVVGHWIWGGALGNGQGWLESLGFIDFAGSTVVHSVGGWVALAGLIIVGPRIGRFDDAGKPHKIHPHNLPLAYLGVFILFFGWFGFNAGSTLKAGPDIAGIALNTMLAASFGSIVSGGLSWFFQGKPDAEMIANGLVGGLVGITAGCAAVDTGGAVIIGMVSGAVVFGGTLLMERVFKLDDVVSAVPAHGFCGVWGTLAVAIFIRPELLQARGQSHLGQLGIQAMGIAVVFLWAFGIAFLFIFIVDKLIGMRVPVEHERLGLNIAEHGATTSLVELAGAMTRVGSTTVYDEDLKVPADEGTEEGDLARVFNTMIDTLGKERARTLGALEKERLAVADLENSNAQLEHRNVTMKSELEMARLIQEAIIPKDFPAHDHIKFSGYYSPMDALGGDYYDVFVIDETHVSLVIADVSGHGVSSALITSMLKVSFASHTRKGRTAGEIMEAVNKDLCAIIGEVDKYSTAFVGIVDSVERKLYYSSAGHVDILVFRSNRELIRLPSNAPVLGIDSHVEFPVDSVDLESGDRIILYTDGVIEARDKRRRFFGETHLEEIIRMSNRYSAERMVKSIIEQIHHFKEDAPADDDITILIGEITEIGESGDLSINLGLEREPMNPSGQGPVTSAGNYNELQGAFRAAQVCYRKNEFLQAAHLLKGIAGMFPSPGENLKAWHLLGFCYYRLSLFNDAHEAWLAALAIDPANDAINENVRLARKKMISVT